MGIVQARRILRTMALEFIQNLPLTIGFALAVPFWQRARWAAAVSCTLAGSVAGALAIRLTEPRIVPGHRETARALIGNAAAFALLMALMARYLAAGWSTWWTDGLAGLLAALALAGAQELANEARLGLLRSLWLGLSCSVGLILFRTWIGVSAPLAALVGAAWVTLVMGASYLFPGTPERSER
jgi:hypothetical protein